MRRLATGTVLALAAASMACAPRPDAATAPVVVVTIFPVADLVARVAGGALDVRTLLPTRASPSTWEATPAQVREVSHAAGFVTVGGGLDGWLDHAAGLDAPLRLRLTDGLDLRNAEHGHAEGESGDPHVWLDPVLVRDALLPRIADFVRALAPADAPGVSRRAAALADSLTALDGEIREILDGLPLRAFIATHDAWSYFAARYGLEPLGSLYERPGHEPSARGLAALVDAARSAGLRTVLSEPQLAETAARALAAELDAVVATVDPLGGPELEGRRGYMELMRFNARAFAGALGST